MKMQTCRRHPNAGRFLATCSGCAQELYDMEQANRAKAESDRAVKVRTALGLPQYRAPRPDFGESATRVSMWSVRELGAVYARVGGTVTTRQVNRALSDGDTYAATEVTLTVTLPSITGPVEVFTDLDNETDDALQMLRLIDPDGYDVPGVRRLADSKTTAAEATAELLTVQAPLHATGSAVGYRASEYTVKTDPAVA